MSREKHKYYMKLALEEAKKAYALSEVPVGCVIVRVKDGEVIASGHNTSESEQTALGHAEINAIHAACKKLESRRLSGCRLYVTLEPCMMCLGAAIASRLDMIIFGACDRTNGCCGEMPQKMRAGSNGFVEIVAGIEEADCQAILTNFFEKIRFNF